MSVPRRFCAHGHDTAVCGRTSSRTCRDCHRAEALRRYHRDPANREEARRIAAENSVVFRAAGFTSRGKLRRRSC